MRIVLTGSSGRIGRAIFGALASVHEVIGCDRMPFATTHITGDIADEALLQRVMEGADAVIHTAGLHAPHVGHVPDREFERINVEGTARIGEIARACGVGLIVFTSTTALYGTAVAEGDCTWIDENIIPQPQSVYHRTKIAAEAILAELATDRFVVRVLRMARCFPQSADLMAAYRLHRGIDARDVADAHALALAHTGAPFERVILSGATPFSRVDCDMLAVDAAAVIRDRSPALAEAFDARGWPLPRSIDRVYDPSSAEEKLGWRSRYGFDEVLAQLDRRSAEILPLGVQSPSSERAE